MLVMKYGNLIRDNNCQISTEATLEGIEPPLHIVILSIAKDLISMQKILRYAQDDSPLQPVIPGRWFWHGFCDKACPGIPRIIKT